MRLVDHVRIEDPQFPAAIPCIVADEIARQLDELPGDNHDISFDAESYGIVAPPFDSFFVEAETVVHHDAGAQMIQRGLLFEVWDTNPMKELKALYNARWIYVMTPTCTRTAWSSRTASAGAHPWWNPAAARCSSSTA